MIRLESCLIVRDALTVKVSLLFHFDVSPESSLFYFITPRCYFVESRFFLPFFGKDLSFQIDCSASCYQIMPSSDRLASMECFFPRFGLIFRLDEDISLPYL